MPAYDRVHLSEYFAGKSGDALCLAGIEWYAERGIELFLGERAERIDRERRVVVSSRGREIPYDKVVLATGSSAFVPPIPGAQRQGVFVYRTLDDLDAMIAFVEDPAVDPTTSLPHTDGTSLLREALLLADHNSYHLGQLVQIQRALAATRRKPVPARPRAARPPARKPRAR